MAVPILPARPVRPIFRPFSSLIRRLYRRLTYSVHVCLDAACHLEIENQTDILHVDTPSCKVSSNQHVRVVIAQRL
jgi:hypothetical protein